MGILRDGSRSIVHALEQLRVSLETLSAELERLLRDTPASTTGGDRAFSSELRAVLRVALGGKRWLTVTTEVLLLALAEEHAPTRAILRTSGADDRRLRLMSVLMSAFRTPVTEEEVSLIATSRWRVAL